MHTYICWYRGRQRQVMAARSIDARDAAAVYFKAKKAWEVDVYLCELADGTIATHNTM